VCDVLTRAQSQYASELTHLDTHSSNTTAVDSEAIESVCREHVSKVYTALEAATQAALLSVQAIVTATPAAPTSSSLQHSQTHSSIDDGDVDMMQNDDTAVVPDDKLEFARVQDTPGNPSAVVTVGVDID